MNCKYFNSTLLSNVFFFYESLVWILFNFATANFTYIFFISNIFQVCASVQDI